MFESIYYLFIYLKNILSNKKYLSYFSKKINKIT